jgi:hypothetical protein
MKILGTTYAIDPKTLKSKVKEETGLKVMCRTWGDKWGRVHVYLYPKDRTAENRDIIESFFKRHDIIRLAPDGRFKPFSVNGGEWGELKYINYYQTTISTKLP